MHCYISKIQFSILIFVTLSWSSYGVFHHGVTAFFNLKYYSFKFFFRNLCYQVAVNIDIRNIILHYLISSGKFSSTFTFLFFLLGSSSTSKIFQSTLGPISLPSCATTLPDLSILLRQLNLKHDCIQNITVLTCRFFSFLNQRIGRWPCNL